VNFLILIDEIETEFDYQALDYYRLLEAFVEPQIAENQKAKEYIGTPRTIELSKARNMDILAFRPLSPADVKSIHEDNRLFVFSTGSLTPSTVLVAGAVHAFVAFGSKSAFKIANNLKTMRINRPVYRVRPWIDMSGIKQYESPPFGKVSSTEDVGLRAVYRLMAARAVVIAPDYDPFNNTIVDGWNGIIGDVDGLDQQKFVELKQSISPDQVASRAEECVSFLMDTDRYRNHFLRALNGESLDYNEPWIEVQLKGGPNWITVKESIEDGELTQIPPSHNETFRTLRPVTLRQLLDYAVSLRFNKFYVFDSMVENLDSNEIAQINRLLSILGDKIHNILFCMEVPEEWHSVSNKLTFISASEATKQVR
jgi:hypothetical protein